MTDYLFHRLPEPVVGSTLFPLNILRRKLPTVFESEVKKYAGREQLLLGTIPILNCLWNDVLHLSPVHPASLRDALREAGFERFPPRWLQIEPERVGISQKNAAIFLYSPSSWGEDGPTSEDFVPFSRRRLAGLGELPDAARAYYRETKLAGKRPLLFHLVPHILFRGEIQLQEAKIIEVRHG